MRARLVVAVLQAALLAMASPMLVGAQGVVASYPADSAFVAIAVGAAHACALDREGVTYCWGDNTWGQSGGVPSDERAMGTVVGAPPFLVIAAGGRHSCGLTAQGEAWCWGANTYGQLGMAGTRSAGRPQRVRAPEPFTAIALGATHSCSLTREHAAWCWGDQWSGAAGAMSTGDNLREPYPVRGGHRFSMLASGSAHTCGLELDGSVWCWGVNDAGQVTGSKGGERFTPVRLGQERSARAIAAAGNYSVVVDSAGAMGVTGAAGRDRQERVVRNGTVPADAHLTAGPTLLCVTDANGTNCLDPAAGSSVTIGDAAHWRQVAIGELMWCGLDARGRVQCLPR